MADTTLINNYLKKLATNLTGKPIYRLVWGPSQTELRTGTFNDYSANGIVYLRTVRETREVPKYTLQTPCFVLERLCPPEECFNSELPLSREGSYEPLWFFLDKKNNPLEPTFKVVEFIVTAHLKGLTKTTPEQRKAYYDMLEEKEERELKDSIDSTVLMSQLHSREAILVPKEYEKVKS